MSRLLVIRLSSLGDVLHTLPAVRALRSTGLYESIAWMVEPAYAELVRDVGEVEVIEAPLRSWRRRPALLLKEGARVIRRMRGFARGQVAVDFQGLVKSGALMGCSGAKERWGFDRRAAREPASILFSHRHVPVDRAGHVIEWNLELASAVAGRKLELPRLDFSRYVGREQQPAGMSRGAVVIHPGAGNDSKVWPAERFVSVARELARSAEVWIVWGERERTVAEEIARRAGVHLAPPTSLRQMAAMLAASGLVISVDSGPLHLAAAMNIRVAGIYGPTSVGRNGPWGQSSNCAVAANSDVREIGSEAVLAIARRLLAPE